MEGKKTVDRRSLFVERIRQSIIFKMKAREQSARHGCSCDMTPATVATAVVVIVIVVVRSRQNFWSFGQRGERKCTRKCFRRSFKDKFSLSTYRFNFFLSPPGENCLCDYKMRKREIEGTLRIRTRCRERQNAQVTITILITHQLVTYVCLTELINERKH